MDSKTFWMIMQELFPDVDIGENNSKEDTSWSMTKKPVEIKNPL